MLEQIWEGFNRFWHGPEKIKSDPETKNTVQIAFYHGNASPLIARLFSLPGHRVSGVGAVITKAAIIPVQKEMKYELRSRKSLLKKWIILDTGIVPSDVTLFEFAMLENKKCHYIGCMTGMSKLLNSLDGLEPTHDPSSYMKKVLEFRKNKGVS